MDPGFELKSIDHVVIRVRDVPRSIAFYRDVLGCRVERTLDELGLYQLRAGASLIDLVDVAGPLGRRGGPPPGADSRNMDHLCLRIDPFDAGQLDRHLRAHGIEPGAPERRYGADGFGRSVYIEDPEGNTIELKGPPESPARDHGSAHPG